MDFNKEIVEDIKHFWKHINHKELYKRGYVDHYDDNGEEALHESVEYFHFNPLLDTRVEYNLRSFVVNDKFDLTNRALNILISHFYGPTMIHNVLVGEKDNQKALVDFHRLTPTNFDEEYYNKACRNIDLARSLKIPVLGTTELKTSLLGESNKVADEYGIQRHTGAMLPWVAQFIENGVLDRMLNAKTLKEAYKALTSVRGIGAYYGYHGAVDFSMLHETPYNLDEDFCVPGPGARYTLDLLMGGVKQDYGQSVIHFRRNYRDLIGEIFFHDDYKNIEIDGRKLMAIDQDELKVYGTEVGLCQYGIYHKFKEVPKLIGRRKVAVITEDAINSFYKECVNINEETKDAPCKPKSNPMRTKNRRLEQEFDDIVLIEVPEDAGASCEVIVNTPKPAAIEKPEPIETPKPKPKKAKGKGSYKPDVENLRIVVGLIKEIATEQFSHAQVAQLVTLKGITSLKQDGNWKESWQILQWLVENGKLAKEKTRYTRLFTI